MPILTNIGCLVVCPPDGPQADLGLIRDAVLVWEDDRILWRGRRCDLPDRFAGMSVLDAFGKLVIPGMIDCHTHLAFGGWRAEEFEQRLRGKSYLQIAREGGGIASTAKETREATEESLVEKSASILEEMRQLGVTTVECKSGYGLDAETELKLLRVYSRLSGMQPVRLVPTLLAHVVPMEYQSRRSEYVRWFAECLVPEVSRLGLARFCDVFVEESAFTVDEGRQILNAARQHGLLAKVHADQLTGGRGALLAAEMGCVSADHLENVSEEGIRALAAARVTAVILPLVALFLGQPPMPARRMIDAGVSVAVATDFNPGSAPSFHLPLAMTLACLWSGMTPGETLKGATVYAARVVGLSDSVGSMEVGRKADFAVIDAPDVNHWIYHFRPNACLATFINGCQVWASRKVPPIGSSVAR